MFLSGIGLLGGLAGCGILFHRPQEQSSMSRITRRNYLNSLAAAAAAALYAAPNPIVWEMKDGASS